MSSDLVPVRVSRRTAIALVAGSCWAASVRALPSAKKTSWSVIDEACQRAISDRMTPGVAVGVMHAGKMVYSRGFGLANIETATPVTPHTVFRIGSITKQFTGAAIALLHEDGKLGFDDKLSTYLPEFPHSSEVTLRQMLTHTSGLGNYTQTDTRRAFFQAARLDYDHQELLQAMRATSPLFIAKPGTKWEYSNTAFVLLGLVVEKASGQKYADFLKARVLGPAGLKDTAFDDAAAVVAGRANGYTPDSTSTSGFDNASFISMTFPGAAGSLRSTTEDLCQWHNALLGGRVLKPDSLREMLTPGRLSDGTIPTTPSERQKGPASEPMEYGFGIRMSTFENHRTVGHGGGINGFVSDLRTFPDEKISAAVLFNCDFSERPTARDTIQGLQDTVARAALEQASKA